ncbi:hypothetical protein Sjap_014405 [Stephania japonica]|uniref:Uncharacterized protein n=1 Tax=Stephania japonica TaxID=461633 RepID=A0AAP0J1M2_9MAGN
MGLLIRRGLSVLLLLSFLWILWSTELRAQSPSSTTTPARALDALLQDYAYMAFVRPRTITGTPYDGEPPSNLTGIKLSAMRLRSGSLRSRGVSSYKEFQIPTGVVEEPYVERLALVYQNLGNWSLVYYPLPGYTYLAPVLGLLAYDASNLSATNIPELDIRASKEPILISFPLLELPPSSSSSSSSSSPPPPSSSRAKCVWFDLRGFPLFSNVVADNMCSTTQQGHFSIVVESTAPSPALVAPPPPKGPPAGEGGGEKDKSKVWKIVGSVVGGFVMLVLLVVLVFWVQRCEQQKKMVQMEKAAEVGESLQMTSIGNTRAPVAMGTRTQPVLENEYVP